MPLNDDSEGIISLFRGTFCDSARGRKRSTKGMPSSSEALCEAVLKKLNASPSEALNELEAVWETCLPKKLSNKISPRNIRNGTLYVFTVNASARQEATFCEREILKKVKQVKKCAGIKKIRFL